MWTLLGLLLFFFIVFFVVEICIAVGGFLWLKATQRFCDHVDKDGFTWKYIQRWFGEITYRDNYVFKCQKCGKELKLKREKK
jgi:hypothetical protein